MPAGTGAVGSSNALAKSRCRSASRTANLPARVFVHDGFGSAGFSLKLPPSRQLGVPFDQGRRRTEPLDRMLVQIPDDIIDRPVVGIDQQRPALVVGFARVARSEEHTSELQSHVNLVCRLLLEKKKTYSPRNPYRSYSTPTL